ncbi:hypothetical protein M080_4073 [Bacteroides fragilis str. 3397 T10]|nr:hypothetical protein M080_4073 [Bacteroides fragilis str. 3397 T10]
MYSLSIQFLHDLVIPFLFHLRVPVEVEMRRVPVSRFRFPTALLYRPVYLPVDITYTKEYACAMQHTPGEFQCGICLVFLAQPVESHQCDFLVAYRYGVHIPVQFNVRQLLFRSLSRFASTPKWILNMSRLKQIGELYSTRCHRVKWLSENDHLKYPDSEPNCGLVFLFIRNLFTSTMCLAVRRMFRISTNAICE